MPKFDELNHIDKLNKQLGSLGEIDTIGGEIDRVNGKIESPAVEASKVLDNFASAVGMNSIKSMEEVTSGTEKFSVLKKGLLPEKSGQLGEFVNPAIEMISGLGGKNELLAELSEIPLCHVTSPFLHDSTTKEETMELQLDSRKYKDFLRLVEELAEERDWVRHEVYELFCKSCEIRQERLLSAICHGKINFQIKTEEGEILNDGSQEINDLERKYINAHLSGSLGESEYLLLDAESFLAWLKSEYPYEGEEQVKEEEPEENDSVPSLSPKRESNLLKIIGGFVQTAYLQKDISKYRNGDKPNISAIAEAFQDELSKAGYSYEGFKDRSLRDIISDALKQIKENKNS